VASGERLIAAAAATEGLVLMVAENSQYWHEVVEAKRLIAAGTIGTVIAARAKYWESGHPALNEWAADGSYDKGAYVCENAEGFTVDGGLHWLRPMRMLLGECLQVVSTCGSTIAHMRGPGMHDARFFNKNLHPRSAIEFHAFAPLEALPCVCSIAFISGVCFSYRLAL
jgi:predicted dehydrogenase